MPRNGLSGNAQEVVVRTFAELTPEDVYEILKIRFNVFVMEQGCHYFDVDDIDYDSLHFFMKDGRCVVAYARLFREDGSDAWHVGRVVNVVRGRGVGRLLMEAVIGAARERGASALHLEGQLRTEAFYEKFGFRRVSDVFDLAGIPHVRMEMIMQE